MELSGNLENVNHTHTHESTEQWCAQFLASSANDKKRGLLLLLQLQVLYRLYLPTVVFNHRFDNLSRAGLDVVFLLLLIIRCRAIF